MHQAGHNLILGAQVFPFYKAQSEFQIAACQFQNQAN